VCYASSRHRDSGPRRAFRGIPLVVSIQPAVFLVLQALHPLIMLPKAYMRLLVICAVLLDACLASLDSGAIQLLAPDHNRTGLRVIESSLRQIEALEVCFQSNGKATCVWRRVHVISASS
jgi:hypothetical protein